MRYERLKKQSDFEKLFKSGKRAFSPTLTLVYKPSDTPMMGVSVGKRHGKSVQRNRIKRLLREAFRCVTDDIQGCYMVAIVPKVCEEYSFHTYEKHLRAIVKKEKL
ncbi:MAG: ribonuclease P protein component [Clostridia bacterium]|nr:ribonuclease P protein component [Clostridia bacterium]